MKIDEKTRQQMKEVNDAFLFFQRIARNYKPTLLVSYEFYDKYKNEVVKK